MEKEIEGKRLFSVWRPPAADMKQTYLSFCATVFFFSSVVFQFPPARQFIIQLQPLA